LENVKRNDGVVSKQLEEMFRLALEMENELGFINGDTEINKRLKGLKEYSQAIGNYMSQYGQIKDQLLLRANTESLLNFIVEWAVFDPSIIIGLAKTLTLHQCFSHVPERMRRKI